MFYVDGSYILLPTRCLYLWSLFMVYKHSKNLGGLVILSNIGAKAPLAMVSSDSYSLDGLPDR